VLIPILAILVLLSGCDLPRVSAEDRLFIDLSLEFLSEYQLPKQEFQGTKVGGLSGITYDRQHNRFYAISDDRSEFAPARFYTLALNLDQTNPNGLKIQDVTVDAVTTITDEKGQPYPKSTVDPEGIALSPLGTFFISSEGVARDGIAPFVREFDRSKGFWKRSLPILDRYRPVLEDKAIVKGIQDNLGFEALTLSPGGYGGADVEPFRLFTATESALVQDRDPIPERGATSRLLHFLVEPGKALLVSEHAYPLEPLPEGALQTGLTELLALEQAGHFLSLERSFGLAGFQVKLFQISTGGATDTSTIDNLKGKLAGVQPIRKQLVLDLNQLGIRLDNLEGMSFGPRLTDGSQSLILISDDNFSPNQVTQLLLFRIKGTGSA
jgi:hypothetical protein